ncbi:MAG TPA: kelch repeat-containing protein [Kofleriaceae bacterium]|nr:kelch repeat-containing protein [Kofleriaceae bacterium]
MTRRAAARLLAPAALALAACSGTTGTVQLELATAPGSHVLDAVETLRLTLTNPRQTVEATRGPGGFDLALDLEAGGTASALIVEGLDAAGGVVAYGQSPLFPVAAINAHIVVYVAPPNSVALAPIGLGSPRSEVSGTALDYGAVLAGGRDPDGNPSTSIGIYNAYDHTFIEGIPMPEARAGVALGTGNAGQVYLFGGTGPSGAPTGTLWRFNTTQAPNGGFTVLDTRDALARSGQLLIELVPELYVVTGAPPLELRLGSLTQLTGMPSLPPAGSSSVASDGAPAAIFTDSALVRYHAGSFEVLPGGGRIDGAVATLPGGDIIVLGGGSPLSRDALVIDAGGAVTTMPGVLATGRVRPSVAVTGRHIVVVGGTDETGATIASAEVIDAGTLAPVATVPVLPRTGAFAIALPTDQVLIAGGTPARSDIELFTPGPP